MSTEEEAILEGTGRRHNRRLREDGDSSGDEENSSGEYEEPEKAEETEEFEDVEEEDGSVDDRRQGISELSGEAMEYYSHPEEASIKGSKVLEPKMETFSAKDAGEDEESGDEVRVGVGESGEDNADQGVRAISQGEIEKAKKAEEARERREKDRLAAKRRKRMEIDTSELLAELMAELEPAETSEEMLQRLYVIEKRAKKKGLEEQRTAVHTKIGRLTEVLVLLEDRRYAGIYSESREQLLREYRRVAGTDYSENRKSPKEESESSPMGGPHIMWEYRWEGQDEVYGPYDGDTMQAWKESYFKNEAAVARVVGTGSDFVSVDSLAFTN